MRAPEITYRFMVPADTASPTFEILHRAGSDSQTSAGVVVGFGGVPLNRILVLSNLVIRATPGAGQKVTQLRAQLITPSNLNITFQRRQVVAPIADQIETAEWSGELYLMGSSDLPNILLLQGDFDAGVAANHVSATINGVVIPRGNASSF